MSRPSAYGFSGTISATVEPEKVKEFRKLLKQLENLGAVLAIEEEEID